MKLSLLLKIVSIALISVAPLAFAIDFSPEEEMVLDLMGLHLKEPVPTMDGVDRDEVIRLLREIEAGRLQKIGRNLLGSRRAQVTLLRVGDERSIQKYMDEFANYDSRQAFQSIPSAFDYAHNPLIIKYLAKEFDSNEAADENLYFGPPGGAGTTIVAPPRSVFAGVIAMRIIVKDDAFSAELENWAAEMIRLSDTDPAAFRDHLVAWWDYNRERFDDERYAEVKPYQPPRPRLEPKAKPTAEPPVEEPIHPEKSAGEATPVVGESYSPRAAVVVVGGLLAMIAISILVWMSRRRSPAQKQ